jgi:DNA-binding transcriptional LysR family regulator
MSDRVVSMQTFVRTVDSGSLSAAARALGKSLAAVSRTVTQLEERLGVRLLHRSTRRLALTESGAAFYESAKRILADIDDAELALAGGAAAPRGTLAVTAPLLFGRLHVAPVLAEFLGRHSEVAAQLMLTDRNVNLIEEGVDVAVRIGAPDDSSLVARRLGEVPRVVCASPAYLRRKGTPRVPEELRSHACLRFTGLTPGREWTFVRDGTEFRVPVAGRFACNVVEPAIEAARSGDGVIMVLGYQVAADLAAGRLVRVLQPFEPLPLPVNAMYHSPRLLAARVRLFLDLLAARVPERLAGGLAGGGSPVRPASVPARRRPAPR